MATRARMQTFNTRAAYSPTVVSAQVLELVAQTFSGVSDYSGNAFDVVATATFTHATHPTITTELFYVGSNTWKFHFMAPYAGIGSWSWSISSGGSATLNGQSGTITISAASNGNLEGFMAMVDGRSIVTKADGTTKPVHMNTFQDERDFRTSSIWGPGISSYDGDTVTIQAWLDYIEDFGFDCMEIELEHQVFAIDVSQSSGHSSSDPDLDTFRIVQDILLAAFARNTRVRFFMWGDQGGSMTPIGLTGGINGTVDQRMQRYLCARFGAIPNWFIQYGYDLAEWTNATEVGVWASYLNSHLGWTHFKMARLAADNTTPGTQPSSLDFYTNDWWMYTPSSLDFAGAYALAVSDLAASGSRSVMFDRRFIYNRDSYFTMAKTINLLWAFAMAKPYGVHAVYGNDLNAGGEYPTPAWFQTYLQFWRDNDARTLSAASISSNGYGAKNSGNTLFIFFIPAAGSMNVNLTSAAGSLSAFCVDAKAAYSEVSLGSLSNTSQTVTFSGTSDWVVAVGAF